MPHRQHPPTLKHSAQSVAVNNASRRAAEASAKNAKSVRVSNACLFDSIRGIRAEHSKPSFKLASLRNG